MYEKAAKYDDLEAIYAQCSGPGGLKLTEFIAEKMQLAAGKRLLDVGMNRGYQSCFLAREYGVQVVGIDPLSDRTDNRPHVEHLADNARLWGVEDRVLGVALGVPETKFADCSFDYVYSSTALEMIRGWKGEEMYRECLTEIYRVLRPGGVFGLAEPMHLDVVIPEDLRPLVDSGPDPLTKYLVSLQDTLDAVLSAGFMIEDAAYAPYARTWWLEYAAFDPHAQQDPQDEPLTIEIDGGRWLSLGYVIAVRSA